MQQLEEKYRNLVETASDVIFTLSTDGTISSINTAFEKITGWSCAEWFNKHFATIIHPEDLPIASQIFQQILQGEVPPIPGLRIRSKSGEYLVGEFTTIPQIADGKVVGVLGIFRDITKRKQVEEALRESQERYRKLFQQSVEAIYMFDPETKRILETNNAFLNFLGYTAEEICTLTLYDFVVHKRDNIDAYIYHVLTSGAIIIGERSWRRKDKTLIDVQVTASKIRYGGKDICFVIARDITERKQAEEALRESEGKLNAMLQAISDHMSMMDKDLNIIWANETAMKIFGNDIIGKKCYEVYHKRKEPCEPYPCLTLKAFQDGKIHEHDTQVIDKDGKIIYFYCSANVALRDKGGKPIAVLEVSRNITDRKQAENELLVAKERLQTLSKSLLEILENERRHIARELHDEIGQELTALRINLQNIQHLSNFQMCRNYVGENIAIVDRLFQQVHNLSLDLRPSILDDLGLIPALQWYTTRFGQSAGFNIQFIADPLDHRLPIEIETACFRVAQEALTNVVRHAKARQVTLELRQKEKELKLTVSDDGIGFDVKSAQERAVLGKSFGLLGMQERVLLVGGAIEIESMLSRGTKVMACFPLR